MRSEWTKLRTVRSTYWALIMAAVLGIGSGGRHQRGGRPPLRHDPGLRHSAGTRPRSVCAAIAQLAFAILGVLWISSEYSTGMIRTSLTAVPKRGRMLAAKSLVFAVVTFVVGEVISFVTFFVGQALICGNAPHAALGDHGVPGRSWARACT